MQREKWSSNTTFLLAAIGSAVGLGNAWRFPGQAAMHGGGTFLVIYIIALVTAGYPLLLTELALGRKMQSGAPGSMAGIKKGLEWIGWAAVGTAFVISCYYSVILAWILVMIFKAFSFASSSAPQNVFYDDVIKLTDSIENTGGLSLTVLAALAVSWLLIYLCIKDGTKSIGKIIKPLVAIPFVLLVVMAITGVMLPNGIVGVKQYFSPTAARFFDYRVWIAAYGQVFYSLSLMMALMFAFGSYLDKDANLVRDAAIITVADGIVSIISGLVIFSTLGYMAGGEPVAEVKSGIGLAFSAYPTVLTSLPGGDVFKTAMAVIFYITLFTLALDSAFSIVEGIIAAICDKFGYNKKTVTRVICAVDLVLAAFFCLYSGMYWLDIVDVWINSICIILLGILECIAAGWIYGANNIRTEINKNSKIKITGWFDYMVKFLSPLLFLYMLVMFLQDVMKNGYGGYPSYALITAGWLVTAVVFVYGFFVQGIRSKN